MVTFFRIGMYTLRTDHQRQIAIQDQLTSCIYAL